jgi:hypothetical protein
MNQLKNLTLLIVLTIFFSNTYAQNKKPILRKKDKTAKKKLISKRVSDSVSMIVPIRPTAVIPVQEENGHRGFKENFRAQKSMFIASNQTEYNCAGAFFSHTGLFVKYSKEDKEWTLLCENIKGFNYQKGKEYEIIVNIYDIDYGSAGCADDCPRVKYELVKIVSKKIPK